MIFGLNKQSSSSQSTTSVTSKRVQQLANLKNTSKNLENALECVPAAVLEEIKEFGNLAGFKLNKQKTTMPVNSRKIWKESLWIPPK